MPGWTASSPFSEYLDPEDPDVVYIENTGGDMYVEKADVTRRSDVVFDHLRATAQNPGTPSGPSGTSSPSCTSQKGTDRGRG